MSRNGILVAGRRGFALREAAACVCVVAIAGAFLVLGAGETRRQGRLAEDIGKLKWHGSATESYAADHDDRYWSFASQPFDLAVEEALEILVRLTGREELGEIEVNWYPHVRFSQLVLADWMGLDIPDERFISTGDEVRLTWASDPANYDQLGVPAPGFAPIPYSSSFQVPPAFHSFPWSGERAISPGTTHNQYLVPPDTQMGPRRITDVAHPADKVFLHDSHAWHYPVRTESGGLTQPYWAYGVARLPVLFADGAVTTRRTADANPGWQPNAPFTAARFLYDPRDWEPPAIAEVGRDFVTGHYRFTRGGLGGRDFGPESDAGLIGGDEPAPNAPGEVGEPVLMHN